VPPPLIATALLSPLTATGVEELVVVVLPSWPSVLSPQHLAVPLDSNAHAWVPPPLIAGVTVRASARCDATAAVGPTPHRQVAVTTNNNANPTRLIPLPPIRRSATSCSSYDLELTRCHGHRMATRPRVRLSVVFIVVRAEIVECRVASPVRGTRTTPDIHPTSNMLSSRLVPRLGQMVSEPDARPDSYSPLEA
jgi:hypothetical protein